MSKIHKNIARLLQNKFLLVITGNGTVSILKLLMSVISNKVVAIFVGASGLALIGQLSSFISITLLVSSGGFNQGLTKYVSEYKANERQISSFVRTSFLATIITSIVSSIVVLILAKYLSKLIFFSETYSSILIIFAFSLVFYNINNLFLAIINGYQAYKSFFKVSLLITLIGVIFTISLVYFFSLYGALLSMVTSQAIVMPLTYLLIKKYGWIKYFFKGIFEQEKLMKLLRYTSITILGAIMWPIVHIWIRTYVINNISSEEAGLWEAVGKINDYIVRVALGAISVYLLPRFAELSKMSLLKKELLNAYKVLLPLLVMSFGIIYVFREYVILILYTKEFLKAGDYLLLQMVGTLFWMMKLVPMNLLLSKGFTSIYLKLEIGFCFLYLILSYLLIPKYGIQGIQASFAAYNLLYFAITIWFVSKRLLKQTDNGSIE